MKTIVIKEGVAKVCDNWPEDTRYATCTLQKCEVKNDPLVPCECESYNKNIDRLKSESWEKGVLLVYLLNLPECWDNEGKLKEGIYPLDEQKWGVKVRLQYNSPTGGNWVDISDAADIAIDLYKRNFETRQVAVLYPIEPKAEQDKVEPVEETLLEVVKTAVADFKRWKDKGEFPAKVMEIRLAQLSKAIQREESHPTPQPPERSAEEIHAIKFATWYSGMDEAKVVNAYKRFLNEQFKSKEPKEG